MPAAGRHEILAVLFADQDHYAIVKIFVSDPVVISQVGRALHDVFSIQGIDSDHDDLRTALLVKAASERIELFLGRIVDHIRIVVDIIADTDILLGTDRRI